MSRILLNNKYRIIKSVVDGKGGFGRIYKIKEDHLHLGETTLALKELVLNKDWDRETCEKAKRAFLAEAKILTGLRIDSVPRVKDFFIENECLLSVMDYIDGKNLSQTLKIKKFSIKESMLVIEKLLKTIHSLHTNNPKIIHRDIKPQNIILQGGKVWLVDFGLAKIFGVDTILPGAFSPSYSPPEQRLWQSTDQRGDIYSVGATFYYILTGTDPTDSLKRYEKFKTNQKFDPLPNINEITAQIPKLIVDIVHKALAIDKEDRFTSANEMLTALVEANKKIENVDEYFNEGKEYFDKEDWDKAIEVFQEVIKIEPDLSSAFFYLGYCYKKKDIKDLALEKS